jgi:hypothetical protein
MSLSLARLRRGDCCIVVVLQVIIDHADHLSFNGGCVMVSGYLSYYLVDSGGSVRGRSYRVGGKKSSFSYVHHHATITMNPSTFKNPFSSGLGRVRKFVYRRN